MASRIRGREYQVRSIKDDLNDLVMYRNGAPDSAKFWRNIGMGIVAYWMIMTPEKVWANAFDSVVIASVLVFPDTFKRFMEFKTGGRQSKNEPPAA